MNQTLAIEMAPFTLAEGVSQDGLLEASDRLERDFLAGCDGYLGRILARQDQATWTDIVFWRSDVHAARAMEAAATSLVCSAYFKCMAAADHDDPGHGVTLFRSVKRYGSIIAPG
jgi:hypothetical protein